MKEAMQKASVIANKIKQFDSENQVQATQQPQEQEEPAVIKSYRVLNDKLLPDSPNFDQEYNDNFEVAFNTKVQQFARSKAQKTGVPINKVQVTDSEVGQLLKATEKAMNPAEQPKKRATPPRVASPRPASTSPKAGVPNMTPEQKQLYKMWAKSDDPLERAAAKQIYIDAGGKIK
jgi:hypothetical protein